MVDKFKRGDMVMYQINYSEGKVGSTRYSQNTGPTFSGSEVDAHDYLRRESHGPYIGGTSRRLSLWCIAEDGSSVVVEEVSGCDCHTPERD